MARRPLVFVAAVTVLALIVALPALAGQPEWARGRNADKVDHAPSTPITIAGVVESSTGADGRTVYTLADGGTTYTLHAGPWWFFGDDYPLEAYVGDAVTIEGELAEGSTDVDVISVDGTALREPGRPPWAGGWKVVGEIHPGWSQDKADRFAAKTQGFGGCFPPGHCKDKSQGDDLDEDESAN